MHSSLISILLLWFGKAIQTVIIYFLAAGIHGSAEWPTEVPECTALSSVDSERAHNVIEIVI